MAATKVHLGMETKWPGEIQTNHHNGVEMEFK